MPNALIKGRARAAHRAARIWQKLEFSTNATNAYERWVDESVIKAKTAAAAPPAAAPAPAGEVVRLHETVDFARVRDVPMMSDKDRLNGLDLFFKVMDAPRAIPLRKAVACPNDVFARNAKMR